MSTDPRARLLGNYEDGDVDPNGRSYLSTRADDPFTYRASSRVSVVNRQSGRLIHYRIHGVPTGFRPDWRECMARKGEIRVGLGSHSSREFQKVLEQISKDPRGTRLNNVTDPDDPYVYRLTDIHELKTLLGLYYELRGVPVDVKQHWRDVIHEEQAAERSGARYSWDDEDEDVFAAYYRAQAEKERQRSQRPQRKRPQQRIEVHYRALGLKRTATKEEAKRAYRRLARQLHPDVNPAPDAGERFVAITEAYQTLLVVLPD